MNPIDNTIKFVLSITDENVNFFAYKSQSIKNKQSKIYIA
ncbi:hypothetical protein C5L31_000812, partial [Secundilactobacillus malefermentans]